MLRIDVERLGHGRDHERLADGLAAVDRKRLIGIGPLGVFGFDKYLARHLFERAEHLHVADAAAAHGEQKLHPRLGISALEFLFAPVAVGHPRASSVAGLVRQFALVEHGREFRH